MFTITTIALVLGLGMSVMSFFMGKNDDNDMLKIVGIVCGFVFALALTLEELVTFWG